MMKQIYKYILTAALLCGGAINAWASPYPETSGTAPKKVGSTYYVLYEDSPSTATAWGGTVDYNLTGPGLRLTFEGKNNCLSKRTTTSVSVEDNKSTTLWSGTVKNSYAAKTASNNCNVEATKITFKNASITAYTFSFQKVYVTMASYCDPVISSLAFGSDKYLNSDSKTIKIYWSNTANQNISLTGGDGQFEINKTTVGCSAGKWGNTIVTVTYKRTAVGTHTATLKVNGKTVTITGSTTVATPVVTCPTASTINSRLAINNSTLIGGSAKHPDKNTSVNGTFTWTNGSQLADCNEIYNVTFTPSSEYNGGYATVTTCNIAVPVNPVAQSITWDKTHNAEITETDATAYNKINGTISLTASTSGHDATVTYTSNNPDIAYISGTQLVMVKPGKLSVTASAAATCNYSAASNVTRYFEILRATPVLTNVSATSLTYGQTLEFSAVTGTATHNGSTIQGTWSWQDQTIMPEVGTTSQTAVFTPTDIDEFAPVTVAVNVTTAKASPNLTWRVGGVLRENSVYNKPVNTANGETGLTISTDNARVTYDAATDRLIIGAFASKTTVKVTVSQAETEHYKYESKLYSITVMPKSSVCVDDVQDGENAWHVDINDQQTFEAAWFGSNVNENDGGNIWWCNTNDYGTGDYQVALSHFEVKDIHQYKGIALGDWTEGLKINSLGNILDNGVYKHKTVVLSIKGVADRVSFDTHIQKITVHKVFDFEYWATNPHWELYESSDMTTWTSLKVWQNEAKSTAAYSVNHQLSPSARYIMIEYKGNFTGFVTNLRITRRHGFEIGADRNNVSQTTLPDFGTETNPLQVPQTLTFRYYSIGSCDSENDSIRVSNSNPAFYADVESINQNVDFDQWGEYRLTVRCTDINQKDTIVLTATDGTVLRVAVKSVTPEITASTGIFHSGTEQNHKEAADRYKGFYKIDFSKCFNGSTPLFDTLYVFGVTGNTERVKFKFDYYDATKKYMLPKLNITDDTTACNAHTPLFVYYKNGSKYSYKRTVVNVAAENLPSVSASNRKFALLGYVPYAYTGANGSENAFITFSGSGNQTVEVTLFDADIRSREHTADGRPTDYENNKVNVNHRGDYLVGGSSAVLVFTTTSTDKPLDARLHFVGDNRLVATTGMPVSKLSAKVQGISLGGSNASRPSAAVAMLTSSNETKVNLTIDDKWNGTHYPASTLDLVPAAGVGSVDMGNENNTLTLDGGIITLHNGDASTSNPLAVAYRRTILENEGQMVIAYGVGRDQTNSKLTITDGTILSSGNAKLRLPFYTTITGGSFLSEDVLCYEDLSNTARPVNLDGKELSREHKLPAEIPASYSVAAAQTDTDGKFYPMLPKTTQRTEQFQQWLAATPDREDEVKSDQIKNLLYQEITPAQQTSEGQAQAYNNISNSADYEVNGELSMLMQLDSADAWRMFVAPFDITAVYVLELDDEGKWEKDARTTALSKQREVTTAFNTYLNDYLSQERPTTLPVMGIVNKFMQSRSGAKIYTLTAYNGKNSRSADYYLYKVKSNSERESWAFSDDELLSEWEIAQPEGSVIMKQGKTYALQFPYCTNCVGFDGYDYWTDKYIMLQGKGSQTVIGTATAADRINEAYSSAATDAVFAGNASFEAVTTTKRILTFDPKTDFYVAAENGTTLRPTQSAICANITNSKGGRVKTISRSGHAVFEEEAPAQIDEGEIVTGSRNFTDESGWKAVSAKAEMLILSAVNETVNIYNASGMLCSTVILTEGSHTEISLPAGVYVVRGTLHTQRVIVR